MADVSWPLLSSFKPRIDGFELSAPSLLRRSQFEDGEDRVRRTAHSRPWQFRAQIDIEYAELAVFRRWFTDEIDGGRLWFNLDAFVDDAYQPIEARIVADDRAPFTARLIDETYYRLNFSYEVRQMPVLDDEAYSKALVGGDAAFAALVADLDVAVNTDLLAAAP